MNTLEERLREVIQNEVQVLVDGYIWRFDCDELHCCTTCSWCGGAGKKKWGRGHTTCHRCGGSGVYETLYIRPKPPKNLYTLLIEADQCETDRKFLAWVKTEMKRKRIRKLKYWWKR